MSAQNLNLYLKSLGELVGINERIEKVRFYGAERRETVTPKFNRLTMHVGRKTFVTLSLELGMASEVIMSITGHKDYKSFKRYLNIENDLKLVSMAKYWGAPKSKTV
jgi:hypothetical protein